MDDVGMQVSDHLVVHVLMSTLASTVNEVYKL